MAIEESGAQQRKDSSNRDARVKFAKVDLTKSSVKQKVIAFDELTLKQMRAYKKFCEYV
jgi:hypothetical protein